MRDLDPIDVLDEEGEAVELQLSPEGAGGIASVDEPERSVAGPVVEAGDPRRPDSAVGFERVDPREEVERLGDRSDAARTVLTGMRA